MTPFAAIDFETADDQRDSACAIGVVRVEGGRVVYADAALIRPPRSLVKFTEIHGLRWADLKDQLPFPEVWKRFAPLLDGCTRLAAHNAPFDRSVLEACCRAANIPAPTLPWVCTLKLSRARWPKPAGNKLPEVCGRLGVVLEKHHHAGADAEACARVLVALESLEAGHADRGDGGGHPDRGASLLHGLPGGPGVGAGDRQAGLGVPGLHPGGGGPPLLAAHGPGEGVRRGDGVRPDGPHDPVLLHAAARVRSLAAPAGPRWAAAAERLIADAAAGGWLPELAGWVADWAAKRAVAVPGSDPCRGCGRPTGNRIGFACRGCLDAEELGGAAGRTPQPTGALV